MTQVTLGISKGWSKILCHTKGTLNSILWDPEYPLCPARGHIPSGTLGSTSASASPQRCVNYHLLMGTSSHQERVFPAPGEDFQGALQSQDDLHPWPLCVPEVSPWVQGGECHCTGMSRDAPTPKGDSGAAKDGLSVCSH